MASARPLGRPVARPGLAEAAACGHGRREGRHAAVGARPAVSVPGARFDVEQAGAASGDGDHAPAPEDEGDVGLLHPAAIVAVASGSRSRAPRTMAASS